MDVYRQAADVVRKVRAGEGTAKALCLEKSMQKKKQTYAVACETLRRFNGIKGVLDKAQFFSYYPNLTDVELVMVLTYDTCFGLGVKTKQHDAARAVVESAEYLRGALEEVAREDPSILERHVPEALVADGDDAGDAPDTDKNGALRLPTYVRVNTLAPDTTVERVLEYFKKRERGSADEDPNFVPSVRRDEHIPDLLVLPPNSDLHKSRLIKTGAILIQDKASCLPAAVLLDAVPVERPAGSTYGAPMKRVVDACSAPGNKTTQLAALGPAHNEKDGLRVLAVEMDARRAETLKERVRFFHASEHVTVVQSDFLELENKFRSRAEGVLVDPSCSASGMVRRVDLVASTGTSEEQERRVEQLARMQEKLLSSALTCFPRARRVVYSTCSIHERENEEVVRRVIASNSADGWELADIMPGTWRTRGWASEGDDAPPTSRCIRCDPKVDKTAGFFVACFDRVQKAGGDEKPAADAEAAE